MDNPTRGIVWIPYELVAKASTVAIAARPDKRPESFRYRGLAALRETAAERGGVAESRFTAATAPG